jgi:hypothetical protein
LLLLFHFDATLRGASERMRKGNRERKEGGAHRTWSGGTLSTPAPAVTMAAAVVASAAKRKKGKGE